VTRRLEKIAQSLEKVAQRVTKPKKWHNLLHYPPSELYKYRQQIIFSPKRISGPLESSPNGEISPNLVTLIGPYYKNILIVNATSTVIRMTITSDATSWSIA
jgi:hypothetical protein